VELKEICLEIEKRYQVKFMEIGTDKDHVHFLVQSIPTYSNGMVRPAPLPSRHHCARMGVIKSIRKEARDEP